MQRPFFATIGKPILIIVAVLFPLTVWGAYLALRTNRNDVKEWLPETFEATRDYQEFQRHFGDEAFVLVSWDGCTLDDPRLAELAHLLLEPPGPHAPHYFAKAVTGASVLDRLIEAPTNLDLDVALARLKGTLIGPDGRQSCLILTLSDLGRENLRKALDQIYSLAQEHLDLSRQEIRMGGPPVDNVAIDLEGERMLLRLMVLSGVIGLSLAWWYLRDVRLTAMVLVGGIYSAALCLALVYVLGGTMNSILLTMPSVVYTTGLAAAMHIVNYYRHGRDTEGLENAAGRALRDSWIPCSLSAGTTALGLISLCISDLVPIRNFGFYTALGVAVTLCFMFLYLPSALQLWPPKSDKGSREYSNAVHLRRMHAVGTYLIARRRLIWVAFVVALVACGSGLYRARTTINLMSLFSPDAEIIHSYSWLESHLGPLVPMEVVVRFDTETNDLTLLERMRIVENIQRATHAIPAVGGTMSAATFAPELSFKPAGGLRGALLSPSSYRTVLNKRLTAHRGDFIDEGYLADDSQQHQELWRISLRVAALADIDYGAFIDRIRGAAEPVLEKERRKGVKGLAGITYTGMTPVVYMAERALLNGLIESFAGAFVMIAIVMSIVLRDVRAGLLTMLPNVFPMAVVFGTMSWLGIALDIGTMMTASVAMGVCVDDTVHFCNWFRRATRQGSPRHEAAVMAYENSAGAIYQSTAIVALGLLSFAMSTFMPTRRFGILMFTLLSCGLVADLALTPSILAGPLGRYFTRGWERGQRGRASGEPETVRPSMAPELVERKGSEQQR
jgi:predicted RND superfamily exporter protein